MGSNPTTIDTLKKTACWHLNSHLEQKAKGKSKYRNQHIIIDGIRFMSKKEGSRYLELRILQTAGEISDLRLQVPYQLNKGGTHSLIYIADFVYIENGKEVVNDAKGYRTEVYKKKRALMKKIYGIEIKET